MLDPASTSTVVLGAVFLIAAAAVWAAGTRLTRLADAIASRTGLDRALIGFVLLSSITSLPEAGTTLTAAAIGAPAMAASNLVGGVALQMAILAIADARFGRGALTSFSASPVVLLQGVFLVLLTCTVVAFAMLGEPVSIGPIGGGPVALAAIYAIGLRGYRRMESHAAWQVTSPPPESDDTTAENAPERTAARVYGGFVACGAIVLVAGWALATTGDALAERTGLGQSVVGATLLAAATSLPEVSTTLAAVRLRSYAMAISNVFGSNAFDLVLLLPADLVDGDGAILGSLDGSTTFLSVLSAVLASIWLIGLLERRDRALLRMGVDSWAVLLLYIAGMTAFATVAGR